MSRPRLRRGGLVGGQIDLPFASVGATEHAMLAASLAKGETVIENAAREPELADLGACLTEMGAQVEGCRNQRPSVSRATDRMRGIDLSASLPDRIETATYAIAVAATGGDVVLEDARWEHNKALWHALTEAGVSVEAVDRRMCACRRNGTRACKAVDIETQPYPGFATDSAGPVHGA